jgi:predicted ATPase
MHRCSSFVFFLGLEVQNRAKKYDSGIFFRGTRKKEHNWPVIPQFRDLGKTANFAHMKIKRLYINNYKSLVDFELLEPNPFSVFVGPNAAGKSNVFEALEFFNFGNLVSLYPGLFGGKKSICHRNFPQDDVSISLELDGLPPFFLKLKPSADSNKDFEQIEGNHDGTTVISGKQTKQIQKELALKRQFFQNFSRLFVNRPDLVKVKTNGDRKLRIDAGNLENVLLRLLQDEHQNENINDWLQNLIPELERIEVVKSELSADLYLRIFEKHLKEPIPKDLISDGTFNIVAILTALFQSDEPQFLCIEEPENGLTPYVQRELIEFFREICEEKGHYIWLNTHSPFIVKQLHPKEIILLDKKEGITKAKQLDQNLKFKSMPMDEAWLTNSLGGGLPW